MSETEWKLFSYDIDSEDSTHITFIPTLKVDGETRIWMDDLAISANVPAVSVKDVAVRNPVTVYPNPAGDMIFLELNRAEYNSAYINSLPDR